MQLGNCDLQRIFRENYTYVVSLRLHIVWFLDLLRS